MKKNQTGMKILSTKSEIRRRSARLLILLRICSKQKIITLFTIYVHYIVHLLLILNSLKIIRIPRRPIKLP